MHPKVFHYLGAFLAVAVATIFRFMFSNFLSFATFAPFFIATVIVLLCAGPGPGVFATILSALSAIYFFFEPVQSFEMLLDSDRIRTVLFIISGLTVSALVEIKNRKQRVVLDEKVHSATSLLRKEASETLQQSERRYRSLFETSWDGIATTDLDGWFQEANPAFQNMLGYTMEELRARTYRDITPPQWREQEEAIIREVVMRMGGSGEYEKEYVRKDGGVFPAGLRTWAVYDANGRIVGLRSFIRDITERKRAEQALRDAAQRKDEFIATLSHELRNPLASISSSVHVLRHRALGRGDEDRDAKVVLMMERQVVHLKRLVDDLLDITRIASGKIDLKREKIDLREPLRHAIETTTPMIEGGGHRFHWSLPDAPLTLHGDTVRLAQVFTNLLTNAAKYTERGGDISVSAKRAGDEAVVTIEDNGVGIRPEMLPHIFDRFTQVDRTLERAQGGLGIGLALVRSLVRLHGGEVEARSEGVGRGSAFIVRLPAPAEIA
ncbi:ATP-binding protein [Methylocystis sp. JAN1]|uniref:PAS domain-containing sensor histidine kinase n=1 Tax=Methylocystis sp. JAN1 TaxID=3397211 RepID=UPI003FA2AFB3